MFALITNDDGISAPGIHALEQAAREVYEEVLVVAPKGQASAVSHAITLNRSFRLFRQDPEHVALEAYPADCVFFALRELCTKTPDVVLSGINMGPNLGYDTLYSGTVAGAREGAMSGIPSIAFSLAGRFPHFAFEQAVPHVKKILALVREHGLPPDTMLNCNVPALEVFGEPKGYRFCHLGRRVFDNQTTIFTDPMDGEHGWIGGRNFAMAGDEGSDCYAMKNGFVTLSALTWNLSSVPLPAQRQWEECLNP